MTVTVEDLDKKYGKFRAIGSKEKELESFAQYGVLSEKKSLASMWRYCWS